MKMWPLAFEGCFGWLHQETSGPVGVVMCASWEYEAGATRQSWRVLADRLAEAGMPTLRYDYPGCGDSLGSSDAPGAYDAMLKSIASACQALRRHTGVKRVALVGMRLGASAALTEAELLDVEAVALIRPVVRGKSFLAEQRALARLVQNHEGPEVRRDDDPGALEVEGFRLMPESIERIAKIDLVASDCRAPERVLIAGEPGSAQYEALLRKLVARGSAVTRLDLTEVAGWAPSAVPTPPPLADCDAIANWLRSAEIVRTYRLEKATGLATENFRETAMTFGPGLALTGILCRPNNIRPRAPKRAVIFLNTGAHSHIGAGRAAVFHARGLAEREIASLRMDIIGIGDSAWTNEGPLSAIHRAERRRDVSLAIDELRALQFEEISLVGICSGAFLAFQTALADPRVDRILLVNPQFWQSPTAAKLADPLRLAPGSTYSYMRKLVSLTEWIRALRGERKLAKFSAVAQEILARLANRCFSILQRVAPKRFPPAGNQTEFLELLRVLSARGCRVELLVSEGDPARERLAALLPGGDLAALDGLMRVVTAKGADHLFVMRRTREEFLALLCNFLDAPSSEDGPRKTPFGDKAA